MLRRLAPKNKAVQPSKPTLDLSQSSIQMASQSRNRGKNAPLSKWRRSLFTSASKQCQNKRLKLHKMQVSRPVFTTATMKMMITKMKMLMQMVRRMLMLGTTKRRKRLPAPLSRRRKKNLIIKAITLRTLKIKFSTGLLKLSPKKSSRESVRPSSKNWAAKTQVLLDCTRSSPP